MQQFFDVHAPLELGPVVIEVPHAGIELDEPTRRRLPRQGPVTQAVLADSDIGADRIWESCRGAGATLIVARASRYVVDLNTEPYIPSAYEDKLPPQLREIRRTSASGLQWCEDRPTAIEVQEGIARYLDPYHLAVATALDEAAKRNGAAILLSAHTYPSRASSDADVVIGTRHGATASLELRSLVADALEAHGLSVALEAPFAGGYSLARHARPVEHRFALQLEVARRLVCGDGGGFSVSEEGVDQLNRITQDLHARLMAYVASRAL